MRDNIWSEIRRMHEDMDRLFEQAFYNDYLTPASRDLLPAPGNRGNALSSYREPVSDIWQTDKEVVATVELPGVTKEDIKISATDDGLEVTVEKKEEKKEEGEGEAYTYRSSYSGFYRYFGLPTGADTEKIEATHKNGVLEIRIPMKKEAAKSKKQIQVK